MTDENTGMLSKLAQHEESIGQLYKTYARMFPAMHEFWTVLSQDENQHATWIRTLGSQTSGDSKLFTNERRFNITAINTSLEYLRIESEKANEGNLSLVEALTVALNVEQSLIESKMLEAFETDSVEFKHLLLKLQNETVNHRKYIKEVLDKQRSTL